MVVAGEFAVRVVVIDTGTQTATVACQGALLIDYTMLSTLQITIYELDMMLKNGLLDFYGIQEQHKSQLLRGHCKGN